MRICGKGSTHACCRLLDGHAGPCEVRAREEERALCTGCGVSTPESELDARGRCGSCVRQADDTRPVPTPETGPKGRTVTLTTLEMATVLRALDAYKAPPGVGVVVRNVRGKLL